MNSFSALLGFRTNHDEIRHSSNSSKGDVAQANNEAGT
jgi:hypothetical protein